MNVADFAVHVETWRGAYLRLARQYLNNPQDAEDVVGEAVCWGLGKLHTLREDAGLQSWMRRIVVNCAITQLRKRREELPLAALESDQVRGSAADRWEAVHQRMDIQRAIQSRPLWEQRCICMRCGDGLTFGEIAARMDLPVETVKSRWYRGLMQMRDNWKEIVLKDAPRD